MTLEDPEDREAPEDSAASQATPNNLPHRAGEQPSDSDARDGRVPSRWVRVRVVVNYALQLAGDPRWWPRELPLPKAKVLGRGITRAEATEWPPRDATERLRGLADAQFQEAKFWYLLVTYLYVAAALLAAAAFALHEGQGRVQYFAFASVASQIVAALTRFRAARLQALAHEADWRALIMDGRGASRQEANYALRLENLISDSARGRAGPLPGYFANSERYNERRLALNLWETTFFTEALYRTSAIRAVFLAAVVLAVPASAPLYEVITGLAVPSSFALVAASSVLPLWDIIGRIRTWRASANTLDHVNTTLEHLTDEQMEDTRVILPLITDATIATASAPGIPRRIYKKWAGELRERWSALGATNVSSKR
jgi:hypothetical protein